MWFRVHETATERWTTHRHKASSSGFYLHKCVMDGYGEQRWYRQKISTWEDTMFNLTWRTCLFHSINNLPKNFKIWIIHFTLALLSACKNFYVPHVGSGGNKQQPCCSHATVWKKAEECCLLPALQPERELGCTHDVLDNDSIWHSGMLSRLCTHGCGDGVLHSEEDNTLMEWVMNPILSAMCYKWKLLEYSKDRRRTTRSSTFSHRAALWPSWFWKDQVISQKYNIGQPQSIFPWLIAGEWIKEKV